MTTVSYRDPCANNPHAKKEECNSTKIEHGHSAYVHKPFLYNGNLSLSPVMISWILDFFLDSGLIGEKLYIYKSGFCFDKATIFPRLAASSSLDFRNGLSMTDNYGNAIEEFRNEVIGNSIENGSFYLF